MRTKHLKPQTAWRTRQIPPVKYFSFALARSSASKYHTVMAYLRRQSGRWVPYETQRGSPERVQVDRLGVLTWCWRRAEPREGSVCPTRTAADGRILALCRQTETFLLGRSEGGRRVPGRAEQEETTLLCIQIRTKQEQEGKRQEEANTSEASAVIMFLDLTIVPLLYKGSIQEEGATHPKTSSNVWCVLNHNVKGKGLSDSTG